jgi:(p)ppGpp synthase/HD superfamily hydrolase
MDIPEYVDEESLKDTFSCFVGLSSRMLRAIDLVKKAYAKRKDGELYLTKHVYPVAKMTCEFFGDAATEEVAIVALCHDLLNDGSLTLAQLKDDFDDAVYIIAKPLVKPPLPGIEELSEAERWAVANLEQFKQLSAGRFEARIIKLIERIDNLHWAPAMDRMALSIYLRETRNFYMPLAQETSAELYSTIHHMVEKLETRAPAHR